VDEKEDSKDQETSEDEGERETLETPVRSCIGIPSLPLLDYFILISFPAREDSVVLTEAGIVERDPVGSAPTTDAPARSGPTIPM
jgi:hypothetical protein